MQFVRPDCKNCIKTDVCSLKLEVDIFRDNLKSLPYHSGKTYAQHKTDLIVKIECPHFVRV